MKILLSAFLLLVSYALTAQNFDITVTERFKRAAGDEIIPIGNSYIQIHPEYNNTVLPYGLGLRTVRAGFTIRKLNSHFEEISAKPVSSGEKKYGPSLYRFYNINGALYLVFQELSPNNVLGSIKMARIDTTTLDLIEEKEVISLEEKKYKETYYSFFQSKDSDARFMLAISPDQNYLLFLCDLIAGKKEWSLKKKMIAVVFDSKMNLVYDKQIEYNVENRVFKFHDYLLDNQGKIYIGYSKITEIEGARKKDVTKSAATQVAIFTKDEKGPANAVVPLKNFSANTVSLLVLPGSGDFVISGVYSKQYLGLISGIFKTTITSGARQAGKIEMLSFPPEIISGLKEDKLVVEDKEGTALSAQFDQDLVLRDGDNHDLILEHNASITRHYSRTSATTFYSGSIVNIAFRDGKTIFSRIPKHAQQLSTNSLLSSNNIVYGDKRIFFYNDDEDNLKKELSDNASSVKNLKDAVFIAGIIGPDGMVTRRVIAKPEDNFLPININLVPVGSGRFLVPMEKAKVMSYSAQRKYMVIAVK